MRSCQWLCLGLSSVSTLALRWQRATFGRWRVMVAHSSIYFVHVASLAIPSACVPQGGIFGGLLLVILIFVIVCVVVVKKRSAKNYYVPSATCVECCSSRNSNSVCVVCGVVVSCQLSQRCVRLVDSAWRVSDYIFGWLCGCTRAVRVCASLRVVRRPRACTAPESPASLLRHVWLITLDLAS